MDKNFDTIQGVLSEFVRLSLSPSHETQITTKSETLNATTKDTTAPWSWTVAEAANTEAVLIPFLIHLAAARNDVAGLRFCLDSLATRSSERQFANIAGGIINSLDPATGKTPLHVASINGSTKSIDLLLRSGALVHHRDVLGHTALYYVRRALYQLLVTIFSYRFQAARQGHEDTVDALVEAGATLGGFDESFAALGLKNARLAGAEISLRIWLKAGVKVTDNE